MITSFSNPQVKWVRRLRERKMRQHENLFYLEGLRVVTEAFEQSAAVEMLVVSFDLLTSERGRELVERERRKGVPLLEVSAPVFKSFALRDGPQGIAAVARQNWALLDEIHPKENDLWVALQAVQDPGNLGTVLRSSDAAGGRGVILLDQSTDPYDPTAIRASMGAVFSQQMIRSGYQDFSAWKRSTGAPLIGASGMAATDYHSLSYPPSLVLLMGSERQGLPEDYLALCDDLVCIPMVGRSDSLNLAAATSIILYEVFNQRRDALSKEG